MWTALGKETPPVAIGQTWQDQLIERSRRKRGRDRFLAIMKGASFNYWFDAIKEIHVLLIQLPRKTKREDIDFLGDFITRVHKGAKIPVIAFDGRPQRFSLIITSETPKDDYEARRKRRSAETKR